MGLSKVQEEILASAQREAEQILADAEKEVDGLKKTQDASLDEKRKVAQAQQKEELALLERKEVANANFEARKLQSASRQALLDEVFLGVREELQSLPSAKRKKLFTALLKKAQSQMKIKTICCNKKDKAYKGKFSHKEMPLVGGFIAENSDGTVRLDYSYETILERLAESELREVATILNK